MGKATGKGTVLYVANAEGAFTTSSLVANITSFGEIGGEIETIETTDMSNTTGYKEYIVGLKDAGSVSIAGHILEGEAKGGYDTLKELYDGSKKAKFGVYHPTIAKVCQTFDAYVTSLKVTERNLTDVISFSAELLLTGAIEDGFTKPTTGA